MINLEQIQNEIAAEAAAFISQSNARSPWGEISAKYLIESAPTEISALLEPILPRVGVAALVGSSDSGKSTFLRGLAMAVSSGQQLYAGFRLSPLHQSAIYVSTEDDQNSVAALLKRQNTELQLDTSLYDNLRFVFDSDNIITKLDNMLSARAADLVIVDAFSDIYTGSLNENNQVRGFLQEFHDIAQRHQCLILFLHHTGKRTESLTPSKHNAIGSQGFEAKMRLLIELRKDPRQGCEHLRHLCIVKGNYLAPTFKNASFELRFSPHLNYFPTGNRVPFEELRERTDDDLRMSEQIAKALSLQQSGMPLTQIAKQLGIPRTTLSDRLKRGAVADDVDGGDGRTDY
ncbi:MAG: AAA family ATPase [Alistipes sp.]|nr:AAA family ATPase [Alistipes sp.]